MAELRYFDDRGVLVTRALPAEKFIIGRVESCQICITDDLASREHARLDQDPDGRVRVRDMGSRNKTFVNGQQITETLLVHGDVIRVGSRGFEFLDDTFTQDGLDLSFLTPDRNDPAGTEWVKINAPITLPLERHAELALLAGGAGYPARPEDVAGAALGRLVLALRAERGFIALRGESKKELRPIVHRGLSRAAGTSLTPVSQTFVYSALLQSVAGRYPESAGQIDAQAGFAATGMVAPIVGGREVLGVVYVDRPQSRQPFPAAALAEMTAAGAHIGALMADASQRLVGGPTALSTSWLGTLRRMQMAMTVPPESSTMFDAAVKLFSGSVRCGDSCDIVYRGDDRAFVLMVDAGGHGVSGFVNAGSIRTAVRTALSMEESEPDIAKIMSAVTLSLSHKHARQLVTCTLVEVNISDGQVRYINAGGPPPLMLVGSKRLVTLDQPALVLGIDPNYGYEATAVDLPSAFRLVCHTDGLIEMSNASAEAFGRERLHNLLLDCDVSAPSAELSSGIAAACDKHRAGRPSDDDAMFVVIGRGT